MPRIPVRTEPYSSPSRQHRHFKNKRDQVLRALGKAAYINGSHFAIMWVSARGDVETYASEMLQGRLDEWFVQGGIAEQAKQLVRSGGGEKGEGKVWEDSDDGEGDADGDEEEKEDEDVFAEEGEKENVTVEEVKGKGKRAPPAPLNTTIANQHFLRSRNPFSSTTNNHNDDPFAAAPRSAPLFPSSTPLTPNEAPLTSTPFLPSSTRLSSTRTSLSSTSSTPLLTPPLVEITLSTPSARTAFLELRFGQLQQGVCKTVAKAWIKIIEPKKQTRCPYNKGESGKPDWWPAGVRHKEPDHLMKPERHSLLLTILRSPKVKVARLQLATAEVVALIKADKVSLLMDVYRVAREEERLRERGEEEGEVRVQVSTLDGWCSEGSEPTRAGRKVARSVTPEVAGEKGRKRSAAVAMIKSHSTSGVVGARKRRSIAASSLSAEVRPRPLPAATANDVFGTIHAQHQPLIGLGLGAMSQFGVGAGAGMMRSHSFSAVPSSSSAHLNTADPSSSSDTSPWPPASLNFNTADVNGLPTPLTGTSTLDPSYPAYHHPRPDPNTFYFPPPPGPNGHHPYPPHPHAIPHQHFADSAMPPFDNALGLENWSFANFLPDLSNGSWQSQPGEASFSFDTLNSGGGPRTPSPAPAEGELRFGLAKGGQVHPSLAGGGQEAFWMGVGEVGQHAAGQGGGS